MSNAYACFDARLSSRNQHSYLRAGNAISRDGGESAPKKRQATEWVGATPAIRPRQNTERKGNPTQTTHTTSAHFELGAFQGVCGASLCLRGLSPQH